MERDSCAKSELAYIEALLIHVLVGNPVQSGPKGQLPKRTSSLLPFLALAL